MRKPLLMQSVRHFENDVNKKSLPCHAGKNLCGSRPQRAE
jgi:hypothetical protein